MMQALLPVLQCVHLPAAPTDGAVTSKPRLVMFIMYCALPCCCTLSICGCSEPPALSLVRQLLPVVFPVAVDAPGAEWDGVVAVLSESGQQSAWLCAWPLEGPDQLVTNDQSGSGGLSAATKLPTADAMACMTPSETPMRHSTKLDLC
jgi:hypothetical protein